MTEPETQPNLYPPDAWPPSLRECRDCHARMRPEQEGEHVWACDRRPPFYVPPTIHVD